MNTDTPPLGAILESFFTDYLKLQNELRPNSIKSYANAWRLFLQLWLRLAERSDATRPR
jgi:hypothetical protein